MTFDARAGLVAAIGATLQRAAWQKRRTHYAANLMSVTLKSSRPWVKAQRHTIYDRPDTDAAHAQFDRVITALEDKLPAVAEHLGRARAHNLAFTAFPKEVWRQVRSNKLNERLNREIKRRTDVVGIIHDRGSIIRLIGAVLTEQHDAYAESRRSLGHDLLARSQIATPIETEASNDITRQVLTT